MPRNQSATRGGRASTVLFAAGAVLAPIAGLLVWFAHSGGALRGAAVLAILGTVLIGLSVVLRPDPAAIRLELQENVLSESAATRSELRSAVTTAIQRTNQSLHGELAALQEQVDALQSRLAAAERRPVAAPASTRAGAASLSGRFEPAPRRSAPAPAPAPAEEPRRYAPDLDSTGYGQYGLADRHGGVGSYADTSSFRRPDDGYYPAPLTDSRAPRRRRHRAED